MRAVIFVNGVVDNYDKLEALLAVDDFLICADGGVRHCLAMGRRPDIVVGDLDSITHDELKVLGQAGVELEQHPAAKNATDLELAIARAIREGATSIALVGALGNRLDQTIANVLLLARGEWCVPILLVEEDEVAFILRGGETVELTGTPGATVSLIPLSESVTGITYTGLEYPLDNHTLLLGSTRGISNVLARSPATIEIESGLALVVQSL